MMTRNLHKDKSHCEPCFSRRSNLSIQRLFRRKKAPRNDTQVSVKRSLLTVLLSTFYLFNINCAPVEAHPKPNIVFTDFIQNQGHRMSLVGTGQKSVLLMKVFTAGLYLKENVSVANVLTDIEKKIDVNYYYPIPGKKLSQFTKKQMKLNMSEYEYSQMADRLKTLDQYFVDLKPGDRYALHYIPGVGTKFIYNNKEVGVVEGSDFAKGIFSVWLGDKPMDHHLKNEILGISSSENINN